MVCANNKGSDRLCCAIAQADQSLSVCICVNSLFASYNSAITFLSKHDILVLLPFE